MVKFLVSARLRVLSAALLALSAFTAGSHAQGVLFRGLGAINESMGGTGIAAPLDSAGAIYTNPASLSGLVQNEVALGLGILIPESSVSSQLKAYPATYGKAESDSKIHWCPSFSMAYRADAESQWTFGLAIAGVGGASSDYAAPARVTPSPANPIGTTNPILQGERREAEVVIMQVLPTVAYAVNENLSFGITPVASLISIFVDPMPFGQDPAAALKNSSKEYSFGLGVNFGVYYDFKNNIKTGFTVKSPMWADTFTFAGATGPSNTFVKEEFDFNLPLILGWGISYDGFEDWLFALDVRYFDYHHAKGFKTVLDSSGKIAGLGWDSILSVSIGVQYSVMENLKVRMGYCYSENPIPGDVQYANVASPLFIQHVLSMGATYSFPGDYDLSVTWAHAFKNSETGNFAGGAGTVTNSVSAETVFVSLTKRF